MPRKFFVGGNYKMNGTLSSLKIIIDTLNAAELSTLTEVVVSPPTIHLLTVREWLRKDVGVAAQNMFNLKSGAYTGETSPSMLVDGGITWVLTGHSERRGHFHESDELVARKTKAALDAGLSVILCTGESEAEHEAGRAVEIVERQLEAVHKEVKDPEEWKRIVIAYEPIWAIGTGKIATAAQAQIAHSKARLWVARTINPDVAESIRIIYGGSVTASNSHELSAQGDVDGFLVGGASLKPDFTHIINCRKGGHL